MFKDTNDGKTYFCKACEEEARGRKGDEHTCGKKDTNFSKFFRISSSKEKEKVFKEVIKKATEEQQKYLPHEVKEEQQKYCPHARPEGAICSSCIGVNEIISLCDSCHCMTKTKEDGKCGKCEAEKVINK